MFVKRASSSSFTGPIDLTGPKNDATIPEGSRSARSVDLNVPLNTKATTTPHHMHQVVNLLRPDAPQRRVKRSRTETPPLELGFRPPAPGVDFHEDSHKSKRKPIEPFPFMNFPPEIRNTVYKVLLTTPNAPIEFQGPTGRNGAKHREQWAKCKSSKSRGRHKKIFLEILAVCKQIHDEASGIIYGCNVFKYRINPQQMHQSVVLPTRHLQLLKHMKLSVISRHDSDHQHMWAADLIKRFLKDGLNLETFELVWFSWMRCHLRKDGLVCHALRLLKVEKQLTVKVVGEARMDRETQQDLEQTLSSKKVEIQRPMRDDGGELRDDD